MGFRPRTEITSLFASLMGRLTAFLPQITKPVGPVMATGVLTVARFVGESRMLPPCSRVSRDASGRPSQDASRRSTPQITKPVGPVMATGVLTVAKFVGKVGCYLLVANWMTHLLANSPIGGCWARRPCHSLVGPPGAT